MSTSEALVKVKSYPTLKVFIASPSDVDPERRAAVRAIEWVSDHVAKPRGWRVEPLMWERDVLPGAGKDVQSVINSQIGEMREVALFLLIMRDKFGTPTKRAGSGTEEEYDRAVAARKGRRAPKRPELSLWFGKPSLGADSKHRTKVEAFKKRVGKTAIWSSFSTTQVFRKGFQDYLTKWVSAELDRLAKPAGGSAAANSVAISSKNALLLGDRVYCCIKQEVSSEESVLTLALGKGDDERLLEALRERMSEVPFAIGLTGGAVRISNVKFERDGRGTKAIVKIAPYNRGWGSYGHVDEQARKHLLGRVLLGTPLPSKPAHQLVGREGAPDPIVANILRRGEDAASRAEARLRAVYMLLSEGVVTEVQRLDIFAPTPSGVKVVFAGKYASSWGGPTQLKLSGLVKKKRGR